MKNRPLYASFCQDQVGMCFAQTILRFDQLVKENDAPLTLTTETERRQYMVKSQNQYIERAALAKLSRPQFYECLARIGMARYYDTDIEKSPKRAVERLIEEELLTKIKIDSPDIIREKFIHTRAIHRLFKANRAQLWRVFEYYHDRD